MSAPLPVRTGVTVQGWGNSKTEEAGSTLTQIDVVIRSREECNYVYNNTDRKVKRGLELFLPELVTESMFCADSTLNTGEVGNNNCIFNPMFRKMLEIVFVAVYIITVVAHSSSISPNVVCCLLSGSLWVKKKTQDTRMGSKCLFTLYFLKYSFVCLNCR